uniref:Uncharacterized protein n=1 Tax=Anguilla anguilla TaxID=7936 RepID=A0A0E9UHW8_ANGAN
MLKAPDVKGSMFSKPQHTQNQGGADWPSKGPRYVSNGKEERVGQRKEK